LKEGAADRLKVERLEADLKKAAEDAKAKAEVDTDKVVPPPVVARPRSGRMDAVLVAVAVIALMIIGLWIFSPSSDKDDKSQMMAAAPVPVMAPLVDSAAAERLTKLEIEKIRAASEAKAAETEQAIRLETAKADAARIAAADAAEEARLIRAERREEIEAAKAERLTKSSSLPVIGAAPPPPAQGITREEFIAAMAAMRQSAPAPAPEGRVIEKVVYRDREVPAMTTAMDRSGEMVLLRNADGTTSYVRKDSLVNRVDCASRTCGQPATPAPTECASGGNTCNSGNSYSFLNDLFDVTLVSSGGESYERQYYPGQTRARPREYYPRTNPRPPPRQEPRRCAPPPPRRPCPPPRYRPQGRQRR
ncbi:MAG: hypothetical protein Q7R62_02215, partial [bacterium]|nr:hypothetical protein [bacterium]